MSPSDEHAWSFQTLIDMFRAFANWYNHLEIKIWKLMLRCFKTDKGHKMYLRFSSVFIQKLASLPWVFKSYCTSNDLLICITDSASPHSYMFLKARLTRYNCFKTLFVSLKKIYLAFFLHLRHLFWMKHSCAEPLPLQKSIKFYMKKCH